MAALRTRCVCRARPHLTHATRSPTRARVPLPMARAGRHPSRCRRRARISSRDARAGATARGPCARRGTTSGTRAIWRFRGHAPFALERRRARRASFARSQCANERRTRGDACAAVAEAPGGIRDLLGRRARAQRRRRGDGIQSCRCTCAARPACAGAQSSDESRRASAARRAVDDADDSPRRARIVAAKLHLARAYCRLRRLAVHVARPERAGADRRRRRGGRSVPAARPRDDCRYRPSPTPTPTRPHHPRC